MNQNIEFKETENAKHLICQNCSLRYFICNKCIDFKSLLWYLSLKHERNIWLNNDFKKKNTIK